MKNSLGLEQLNLWHCQFCELGKWKTYETIDPNADPKMITIDVTHNNLTTQVTKVKLWQESRWRHKN